MRSLIDLNPIGKKLKILVNVPHDSTNDYFFDEFPELKMEAIKQGKLEQFEQFIHIESDKGALAIATHAAKKIQSQLKDNEKVELIHLDYPRGIIDGGRKLSHCVRDLCIHENLEHYKERFETLHKTTMNWITDKIKKLNADQGLFLDIHTMAPWSPSKFVPLGWDELYNYIESFTGSYSSERMRPVNIMTKDDNEEVLADTKLTELFLMHFEKNGFVIKENFPYRISNPFANHHYLSLAKGIAIDIPKHLVAKETAHIQDFPLNEFELDQPLVEKVANCIAEATLQRLG